MMCLSELFCLGFFWTTWICEFVAFTKIGRISALISLNISTCPLTTFFGLHLHNRLLLSHRSLRLCSFLLLFYAFFSFGALVWIVSLGCVFKLTSVLLLLLSSSNESLISHTFLSYKDSICFFITYISFLYMFMFYDILKSLAILLSLSCLSDSELWDDYWYV